MLKSKPAKIDVAVLKRFPEFLLFVNSKRETNGVGINLATLNIDSWTWNVPFLGVPSRVDGKGTFQSGLSWYRSPGSSTFKITGTDDHGNAGSWSGVITFR